MIPIALNVRNFMCYTSVHEPLRFDGIHVAVLTGDNGHGKSALLDAITWALWGRARARTVDDLIHSGASEMEVELEFELDHNQYRVIRKRQRRGKYGSSDLQFAICSEGVYRPLTERSLAETERLIERTLRMSYETFTNSSFIQQGRADSFTTNSPAERKRILAEILELGYYDELEARAKERFKQAEGQLNDERRLAQDWETEIGRRPEYQAQVDRLLFELEQLDARVRDAEQQTLLVRERVTQLEALRAQAEETEARRQRLSAECERTNATLAERRYVREQVSDIFARAEEIERNAADDVAARRELEHLHERQQQHLPLERARAHAQQTLATEQARLQEEIAQREARVRELHEAAAGLSEARVALTEAQQGAAAVRALETERQRLQPQVSSMREEAAEKRTINVHLRQQMQDLRGRMDELQQLSTCPTCQRPMDPRHKQRLHDEYAAQGVALRDQFRAHEASCRQLDARATAAEARLAELEAALRERETVQRRLARAESVLERAELASTQLNGLQTELQQRQRMLGSGSFARAAREELSQLEKRIAAVGYDEGRHQAARARCAELANAERERQLLEQARLSAEHLDAQIAELERSLERLDSERQLDERRLSELREQTAGLPAQRARLEELQVLQHEAVRARDDAREQRIFFQSKLDNCAFLERKQRESMVRQDALRREQGIYGDLTYAFGRRGVQAMIIETAIPEIEEEANRILARMTDGRMYVKFETQRDVRSGAGVIETLDIKISDELGTRSYELFSGGEGFRVNFAIRVALSRLLAQRAGTRLQTLVVDEGFGSQDREGRDRIVEAIQAIECDFEKILVITHLEDLRDRFPVRIEVTKTPQGSVYTVR